MATEEVKLLAHKLSLFVVRVRIALHLKKVEYEFVPVEIFGQKSEILLQYNAVYKKVPVLLHRGKAISESSIIVEYIDEVWTCEPPILPSDPFDRAVARFWAAYIDNKFPPLLTALRVVPEGTQKAEVEWQAAEVVQLLEEAFEKYSKGKGFFGGDTIGFVDIALGCYLGWIKALEEMNGIKLFEEEKVPLLAGWTERFYQDNAVKGVIAGTEEYIELANKWNAELAR